MAILNEELRSLHRQLSRKAELTAMVESLNKKRQELAPEVKKLARTAKAEQRDVTRLERPTVAALVHHLAGDLEEQWETERREAEEALAKYEAAARELETVEAQLRDIRAQLSGMEEARERYAQLLAQKQAAIKAAGGPDAEKMEGKERTLAFLDSQLRGIREALAAGKAAWNAVESVLSQMDTAALRTGIRPGKGIVNDLVAMSDSLPETQSAIYSLEKHIIAFEKKLALSPIRGKLNFHPEDIEIWKPSLITSDMVSRDKIKVAKNKLDALQQRIAHLLEQLRRETEQLQRKKQKTQDALEKMTVNMDWSE